MVSVRSTSKARYHEVDYQYLTLERVLIGATTAKGGKCDSRFPSWLRGMPLIAKSSKGSSKGLWSLGGQTQALCVEEVAGQLESDGKLDVFSKISLFELVC